MEQNVEVPVKIVTKWTPYLQKFGIENCIGMEIW